MQAGCQRTEAYSPELFGAHTRKFFDNFQDNVAIPEFQVYEEKSTYFLPRDEDCENAFHSQADFVNMFLVHQALDTDLSQQQVLLMDKMPNTAFHELLHRAFAPVHGVHRHTRYGGDRVMFKKLIFHLESPAALIFPETATKAPQRCREASLFDAYRRHVLESFRLLNVPAPIVPTAALIVRRRTLMVRRLRSRLPFLFLHAFPSLANLFVVACCGVEKRGTRLGQRRRRPRRHSSSRPRDENPHHRSRGNVLSRTINPYSLIQYPHRCSWSRVNIDYVRGRRSGALGGSPVVSRRSPFPSFSTFDG